MGQPKTQVAPAVGPAWSRDVEHLPSNNNQVLRQLTGPRGAMAWSLNPYEGCEFGWAFDAALPELATPIGWAQKEHRIGVKVLGTRSVLDHLQHNPRMLDGRELWLGTETDPWQPADRDHKLTRQLLEGLTQVQGLDLRCRTRASSVGRDVDLFSAIVAKGGRVRVAVAIPVADEAQSLVLEPRAPKPQRRWLAVQLLAEAKVEVGIHVGPVVRTLNDGKAALTALLTQAKEAGATFVSAHPFDMPDAQREALVDYTAQSFPLRARDARRLLAPSHRLEPKAFQAFLERLHAVRAEVGLDYLAAPTEAPSEPSVVETVAAGKGKRPQQLKLF